MDMPAVVVACDDGALRDRVATTLGAAGVDVVAAIDTVRMGPATSRLRPDAVVLISPRPRHVDLGRIGTLARERAKQAPAVVLLADDPDAIGERARAVGAALVGPVPDGCAGDLAAELRRLCRPR
ncbi:MAG: hypothetical protein M3235_14430 [Actinomycetota bacterium]|nr:hypothetical protein [Actinomycetota bacterium]